MSNDDGAKLHQTMEIGWFAQTDVANGVGTAAQTGQFIANTTTVTTDRVLDINNCVVKSKRTHHHFIFTPEHVMTPNRLEYQQACLY